LRIKEQETRLTLHEHDDDDDDDLNTFSLVNTQFLHAKADAAYTFSCALMDYRAMTGVVRYFGSL
jgi:hypothetical protein